MTGHALGRRCYGLRPISMAMTFGRCSMRGGGELVGAARGDEHRHAGIRRQRDAGGRLADGKPGRRHSHPVGGGKRLVDHVPQGARILGARRDLPLEFLPGEGLDPRRDALLRVRRQRARRGQPSELELGHARALARLRQQRRFAEAAQREAHEQRRDEEQRQPLVHTAFGVGKENEAGNADHAERHQRGTAVAPEFGARQSEEEIGHVSMGGLTFIIYAT